MNVLVYTGNGASNSSVKLILKCLRSLISDHYDIMSVDHSALRKGHWIDSTAMVVFPDGRDITYCEYLQCIGMERLKQYVNNGGKYLGIAGGAYFASKEISFSCYNNALYPDLDLVHDLGYAMIDRTVSQSRHLGIFSGCATGRIIPGYHVDSEKGARALKVSLNYDHLPFIDSNSKFIDLCVNGGMWFENAGQDVTEKILGFFETPCNGQKAAIIQIQYGKGKAILSGLNIEYDPEWISSRLLDYDDKSSTRLKCSLPALLNSNPSRIMLLKSILRNLGLRLNDSYKDQNTEEMSALHIFSDGAKNKVKLKLFSHLDSDCVKDSQLVWKFISNSNYEGKISTDPYVLPIIYHENYDLRDEDFNVNQYFNSRSLEGGFGAFLIYGKVVTSTHTILEKNSIFSSLLPNGTVFVADHQLSGRGRGHNSWISQKGSLQFSLLMNYKSPKTLTFIQYLFALAIVETIKSFPAYSNFPVFIKWPNDLYVQFNGNLSKLGGILISSTFDQGYFRLFIGCGLNVLNHHPTISLLQVSRAMNLPLVTRECLLAALLSKFQKMIGIMEQNESFHSFLDSYYSNWLHSNQSVAVHNNGVVNQAVLVGIDKQSGYLIALQANQEHILLHPDGNSFDMLKGLISQKLL